MHVPDDLNLGCLGEVRPSLPIVLVKGIFDGTDRVLLHIGVVQGSELLTRDPLGGVRVGVLKRN